MKKCKTINLISLVVLIILGALWLKTQYNNRHAFYEYYYSQIPLYEKNDEDKIVYDKNGKELEKGKEYTLYAYNKEGKQTLFGFFVAGGDHDFNELSKEDLSYLNAILDKVLENYRKEKNNDLKQLALDYVAIMDEHMKKNPEYMKARLAFETSEGTATYMGHKASENIGFKNGIMDFTNVQGMKFIDALNQYKEGKVNMNSLNQLIPYESGALIGYWLDELNDKDWKQKLSEQTKENPITLYDLLKQTIS